MVSTVNAAPRSGGSTGTRTEVRDDIRLNWSMYEQHLDEAEFLWARWEHSLVAPDHVLDEVTELEERLLAHLDGLVLGGAPVAERLLASAVESEDPHQVASAVYVLLSPELPAGSEIVRAALQTAAPEVLSAFHRGLQVREREALPSWLPDLLKQEEPARQALSLEVLTSHGVDPGATLTGLLRHEAPGVAAAALRAAARVRLRLESNLLRAHLDSPKPAVRDAAIEAGLLGGHKAAWLACRKAVETGAPSLRLPALMLALGGDPQDEARLKHLLTEPDHRPDGLWALGFCGRPSAAEVCLQWMKDETVAHLAAEAFCAITGLHLQGHLVAQPTEEDALPPLEEEDLDADLVPKPADDLPHPAAEAVAAWWEEARKGFDPERRYLYGKPFGAATLLEALWTAPMRRRHALSLHLLLNSRGTLRVPTQTFTSTQLKALEAVRAAPPSSYGRSFTEGLHHP